MKRTRAGPTYKRVASVQDIDYDKLKKRGIKTILLDYDKTLTARGRELPGEELMDFLKGLAEDFEVIIFSNNWVHAGSRMRFFSEHGIPYKRGLKPFSALWHRGKKDTVLIGDKILTDWLFGFLSGIDVILVQRMK